jgi:hypothetical protein
VAVVLPCATVPGVRAVVDAAVVTSRKCQAGFAPGGGDLGVGVAVSFGATVVPFAGIVVGAGAMLAALAPVDMTGGVTVVRPIRSENVAAAPGVVVVFGLAGAVAVDLVGVVGALAGWDVVVVLVVLVAMTGALVNRFGIAGVFAVWVIVAAVLAGLDVMADVPAVFDAVVGIVVAVVVLVAVAGVPAGFDERLADTVMS